MSRGWVGQSKFLSNEPEASGLLVVQLQLGNQQPPSYLDTHPFALGDFCYAYLFIYVSMCVFPETFFLLYLIIYLFVY